MSRVVFISDLHFPLHHRQAWPLTLKILPHLNADLIYGGGDWFDLEQLSRFSVQPDRMMALKFDIQKTYIELTRLREVVPNINIELQIGNHESRHNKMICSKLPQIVGVKGHSLPEAFQFSDFDIQWHPPERSFRKMGKLTFIHGDEVRIGSVDLARKLYQKVGQSVMCGHYHKADEYLHTTGGEGAWVNSCLRTLRPDWAPFSRWSLGFFMIDFSPGGFFHVQKILYLKRGGRLWTKIDNIEYWS